MRIAASISLILVGLSSSVQALLLDTPTLQWNIELEGGRTLGKGNVVQVYEDSIFVTAQDGSFHILEKSTGTTRAVLEGPSSAGALCQSGVAIVQPGGSAAVGAAYAVYAVIFPETTGDTSVPTSSRILAVNVSDATIIWSVDLAGAIVGNPVVGTSGRFIYVSHNSNIPSTVSNENQNDNGIGFLSVIMVDETSKVAQVAATLSVPDGSNAPLGPPVIQKLSTPVDIATNTTSTTITTTDANFVVVAENWNNGFTRRGAIYLLSPGADWESQEGMGESSYQWTVINDDAWRFSAVAPPIFVDESVYVGGTAAVTAGWTLDSSFSTVLQGQGENVEPSWMIQLEQSDDNRAQRTFPLVDW